MRFFRTFLAQIRLSSVVAMQFRINYLLVTLSVVISSIVEVSLWRLVMRSQESIRGFTLSQFIVYLIAANVTGMIRVNWSNLFEFSHEIRTGRIVRHLLKPVSMFQTMSADWFAGKLPLAIGSVFVFLGLAFIVPDLFSPAILHVLFYLSSLCVSLVLSAQIYFLIFITGFFIAENSSLVVAFNIFGWGFIGVAFPLLFYPEWLQRILDFTPFPYFVYYPVMALLGRLSTEQFLQKLGVALLMCVCLHFFQRWAWHKTTKHLQTVGG